MLLALRYWVLPDIEHYHHQVVVLASRAVGVPVTIGKIEADWRGLRPHLVLTDVRLLDLQGNPALILQKVENVVSWKTLLRLELRLASLEIDAPDLLIRRDSAGAIYVAGLPLSGSSSDGKLSDWLLHQARIVIRNGRITWQDDLHQRPPLVLSQAQFQLSNSGHHHRFAAHISPPPFIATPADVQGDFVGNSFSDWAAWRGELFAQIEQVDVVGWNTWLALPSEIQNAKGGLRTWLELERGQLKRITADVKFSEVRGRLAKELLQIDVPIMQGRFSWQQLEQGFEVSTQHFMLQMTNGFKLPATDFYLRLTGAQPQLFAAGEAKINVAALGDFASLRDYLPLQEAFKKKWIEFSPKGRLADFSVRWQPGKDQLTHFEMKSQLDGLSLNRVGDFPGVEGMTGQINGSDKSGLLELNSTGLKLDAPDWLLEPLSFDKLSGQIGWQQQHDGWDFKLNNLAVTNPDLAGTAFGSYQLSNQGRETLDLTINLPRASINHAVKYLPKDLLGKETTHWLQAGLLGGEAEAVYVRLRGDLKDFPFVESKKGIFQVKAKAQGALIDYDKAWPRVENATGSLLIEAQRMQIDASSAMLAGAKAQKVNITIPDIMAAEPLLQIRGEASGETRHALNFIKHSPIRTYINGFTDNTKARGEGKLNLQLDIPISNKPPKVNGTYQFINNEIDLDTSIPIARNVSGVLMFSDATLQAKDISAQILGGPATVSIHTEPDGELKVNLHGRVSVDGWRKIEPSILLHPLRGATSWDAAVAVRDKDFTLMVTSALQGLGAELPAPFYKNSTEILPLKFELRSIGSAPLVATLQYGDLFNTRMVLGEVKDAKPTIKRGYINFGAAKRVLDKEGLWVTGVLPTLSLEGWQHLLPAGSSEVSALPQLDGVDVSVQKLVGYGVMVNDLAIHSRNRNNGTVTAQLTSKELNGEVTWFPQGKGKLVARLKNASWGEEKKLNSPDLGAASAPISVASKVVNNRVIPTLDVAVDHFNYQGKSLGRLELHASQFDKDILLDNLRLDNPDGVLVANGKWGMAPSQTHMVVKFELSDAGKMLARLGHPNTLKNGAGIINSDLVWSGGPDELVLANVDGHLSLKMSKGQFLKLNPGAGKLLSVLSLQALPKRITLDFTDVFSKGFEFDTIAGEAQIRQGVLLTNDFKLKGSAAQVTLSGQVDLTRETQSLRVRVLPTLGDSVSLLAFAAGPVVGTGVFIANKILRDPLDKLVSFEYNVTGNWVDPQVEKVGQVKTPATNPDN